MRNFLCALILYFFTSPILFSQQSIAIFNGSFEKDVHAASKTPYGWYPYPNDKSSSPDIHSRYYTYFGVSQLPSDGDRFISLATRSDGTTEGLCQYLDKAILSSAKHQLSLDLSLSDKFESRTKDNELVATLNNPCRLEIWGFNRSQERDTLLAFTPTIDHQEWKSYKLFLNPEMQINDLCLIASYPQNSIATSGNILIDNILPLEQMYNHPSLPADAELLQNKSDEDLAEILTRLKQELISSGNTSTALKIFLSASEIENNLLNQSLQNYIYNTERSIIIQNIKILEAIKAENLAGVIKRSFSAYINPDDASQEDVDYFNSADAIFKKKAEEKSLMTAKLDYLKIHRKQFIEEVKMILY